MHEFSSQKTTGLSFCRPHLDRELPNLAFFLRSPSFSGERMGICRNAVVGGAYDETDDKQISVLSKGAVVEANTVLLPGEML